MLIKIFDKSCRELYRLFHPSLWGKSLQINGIPRIYGINKLKLGKNVSINADCVLQCYGGLSIGDNVTISDGAKILTRSLDIQDYISNAQKKERDHTDAGVTIENGVWIASNAVILPGVHIAKNCVIAAGAVVSRSLEEKDSLYGGIPAKRIRGIEK